MNNHHAINLKTHYKWLCSSSQTAGYSQRVCFIFESKKMCARNWPLTMQVGTWTVLVWMLLTPPVQNHIPANGALHSMPPKDGQVEQVPCFQMYLGDPRLANAKHLP